MNWVKDGIEKAAKFVKGEKPLDKDFPILKGHPKARVNAREASENIGGLSEKMEGTMITPLPHMFVMKDLVVDLTN